MRAYARLGTTGQSRETKTPKDRHRERPTAVWRSTYSTPELAKAHVDCRVETYVSPRNDAELRSLAFTLTV